LVQQGLARWLEVSREPVRCVLAEQLPRRGAETIGFFFCADVARRLRPFVNSRIIVAFIVAEDLNTQFAACASPTGMALLHIVNGLVSTTP
jgi:hypothetical protein